jgi:hypothetical protein
MAKQAGHDQQHDKNGRSRQGAIKKHGQHVIVAQGSFLKYIVYAQQKGRYQSQDNPRHAFNVLKSPKTNDFLVQEIIPGNFSVENHFAFYLL